MSYKPEVEYSPTQRVVIDVDGLTCDQVTEFFKSEQLRSYIRGLEFSYRTISDPYKARDISAVAHYNGVEVIANLQLAGSLPDIIERITRANSVFRPSVVTAAAGVATSTLVHLDRFLEAENQEDRLMPDVLLTGVLPDTSDTDITAEFRTSPEEYTERRGEIARRLGFRGLYGAATLAIAFEDIDYFGLGISLDGQDYRPEKGIMKRAVRPGTAIVLGADVIVVGHAISTAENPEAALAAIGESVELALDAGKPK